MNKEELSCKSSIDSKAETAPSSAMKIEEMSHEKVFLINKEQMKCNKQDHDNNRLKFLCIDPACKIEAKLACAECILNDHYQHKYVILEKFTSEISEKYIKINKQAKALEQENQMEEFQKTISEEVHAEFEEIKQLVIKSFEEFEKEYLQNVSKILEGSKLKMDHRDKFQVIENLTQKEFGNFDSKDISQIIDFYQDDKIEKALEENEKHLIKTKGAISKKQVKYFEKFRTIVKDILKNCKTTPIKESSVSSPVSSSMNLSTTTNNAAQSQSTQSTDEKKKRRLTISEENNIIYDAPAINQSNFKSISELQSFAQRSFAGETRRFSNAVHKKIKTEQYQTQPISTQ
ncbi:hypothetical protein ABPG74_004073 [Tetrahymena malaccensis]